MENSIKVIDLKKNYGNKEAVKNINFEIKENEIIGLLGPNGCGKTTTIGMILGLLKPTSGQVLINGFQLEKNRIEISFNDNLDKNFVKDLSSKLFDWTGERWIISFSKKKGEMSIRDKIENKKIKLINDTKKTELYKKVLSKISDAILTEVISDKPKDD